MKPPLWFTCDRIVSPIRTEFGERFSVDDFRFSIMRQSAPFVLGEIAAMVPTMLGDQAIAEEIVNACVGRETIWPLLRECVPYVQRGRFGNPSADELLARLYAVLEPEADHGRG